MKMKQRPIFIVNEKQNGEYVVHNARCDHSSDIESTLH